MKSISDYWNRILDVLQFLKFIVKNIDVVVFSDVFDCSCYYIFDNVYIKQNVLLPGTDKLANEVKIVTIKNGIFEGYKSIKNFSLVKEFEMFKLKTTSQHVDDDVLHLLSVLVSMAGFASLQTLQQQGIDPETIVKAEKMGYVKVISIGGVDQVRMTLMGWQVYSKFKEK